ncbi:hypothetical protein [Thiococcus pfennigii]|uniref:hypothetical protein n=1 Tax=Thiococcus pfennigii TaxID=1057 RepID=UPI001905378C|nr:hypothetical protein [Thiococcus pfennigii]MBK1699729.1 hypothetical protein [Thiococcus pfennigii]
MAVQATIQIDFGGAALGEDSHLSCEVDEREDGLNDGDTDFYPGEAAYFLIWTSADVTYDTPVASAGTIHAASVGVVEREETIEFAGERESALSVPATELVSVQWQGRALGDLELIAPQRVRATASGVAMAVVTYRTTPDAWRLQSPASLGGFGGSTDYEVLIYIRGYGPDA